MKKVLVISGSTASGKSDLAIKLAQKYNGEIISCDSVQVYKGLDIGSAKITEEETQNVKHYLIDIFDLDQSMDVATFQKLAREKIEEISNRNKLPICVGGTGLYIKAILYDYQFENEPQNSIDFSQFTNQELYESLLEKDPQQAEKIHVNNRKRLIRVHEFMMHSDTTRTEHIEKQRQEPIYDSLVFYLMTHRDKLVERINQRVDYMFESGLFQEVDKITQHGKIWDYQGLSAIGYKEFKEYYLNGKSLDEVKEKIKTHTRQFSKRQMTWFKNQMHGNMVDILESNFLEKMESDIQTWINSQE